MRGNKEEWNEMKTFGKRKGIERGDGWVLDWGGWKGEGRYMNDEGAFGSVDGRRGNGRGLIN